MKKNISLLVFVLINVFTCIAQKKISVQLLNITHNGNDQVALWANTVQKTIADKLVNNPSITLIEREKIEVIHNEKELQKSEDFIDGKVVKQGKAIGAEFIVFSEIDVKAKILWIKCINLEKETIQATEKCDIAESLYWKDDNLEAVEKTINRLISKILPIKRVKIIRANNAENTQFLIAAGQSSNLKKKQNLIVYYLTSEKIEEEDIEREVSIGKGKIIEIQGENFSILELTDGEKNIATQIQKGIKLFCKIDSK